MGKNNHSTRNRTKFTSNQYCELENLYAHHPKPTKEQMVLLGKRTKLPLRIIQVWFQNRRVKERNQSLNLYDSPLPPHPSLSPLVQLMHMPSACQPAYLQPPVVPSSATPPAQPFPYPPQNFFINHPLMSCNMSSDYYIGAGDFSQSLAAATFPQQV